MPTDGRSDGACACGIGIPCKLRETDKISMPRARGRRRHSPKLCVFNARRAICSFSAERTPRRNTICGVLIAGFSSHFAGSQSRRTMASSSDGPAPAPVRRKASLSLRDTRIAGLYDLEHTIGNGHFAVVKLARHVFTGEKVSFEGKLNFTIFKFVKFF